MKNVEKTLLAVTAFRGKTLTAKEIVAVTLAAFPDVNPVSILPSDYAGSKYSNVQLFEKAGAGKYLVLAKPILTERATRKTVTLTDALASAKAKLADTAAIAPLVGVSAGEEADAEEDTQESDGVLN